LVQDLQEPALARRCAPRAHPPTTHQGARTRARDPATPDWANSPRRPPAHHRRAPRAAGQQRARTTSHQTSRRPPSRAACRHAAPPRTPTPCTHPARAPRHPPAHPPTHAGRPIPRSNNGSLGIDVVKKRRRGRPPVGTRAPESRRRSRPGLGFAGIHAGERRPLAASLAPPQARGGWGRLSNTSRSANPLLRLAFRLSPCPH